MNNKLKLASAAAAISMWFASVNVLAKDKLHQMVKIQIDEDNPVQITTNANGETNVYQVSPEALEDQALLSSELSDLTEEQQQHIFEALENVKSLDFMDKEHFKDLKRIVKRFKSDESYAFLDEHDHVFNHDFKDMHNFVFKVKKGNSFSKLQKMLEKSELNQEQLDELQSILDSKR